MGRIALALIGALVVVGCRGRSPDDGPDLAGLGQVVDSIAPLVEAAVGIEFAQPPRFALRSKQQVQEFLLSKLDHEFPRQRMAGIESAYRLLGLIADSLDLKALLLPLYTEQVVGYYDPDSTTLYVVEGADANQLPLVLAHELVHALQHERLPLETILGESGNADRLAAAQAVLEGHATLAMLGVVMAGQAQGSGIAELLRTPGFWQQYRDQVRSAQSSMPVFRSAPLILREGLIFPYLSGAEFMRWWSGQPGKPSLPIRDDLPQSTEQILHPDRYQSRDRPIAVAFADSAPDALHEDTMGELELRIWSTVLRGGGEVLDDLPLGWGGDRFRVYPSATGPALVLYTVWDDTTAARRFAATVGGRFAAQARPGYRTDVADLVLDGSPAVRVVRAPEGWSRWATLPEARLADPALP